MIAMDPGVAMRTVEVHHARIFAKMGVRSAVKLAQLPATRKQRPDWSLLTLNAPSQRCAQMPWRQASTLSSQRLRSTISSGQTSWPMS